MQIYSVAWEVHSKTFMWDSLSSIFIQFPSVVTAGHQNIIQADANLMQTPRAQRTITIPTSWHTGSTNGPIFIKTKLCINNYLHFWRIQAENVHLMKERDMYLFRPPHTGEINKIDNWVIYFKRCIHWWNKHK